jgi:hypothetical protein
MMNKDNLAVQASCCDAAMHWDDSTDRLKQDAELADPERLYRELLVLVKTQPAELVLATFKDTFFAADAAAPDTAALCQRNWFAVLKPMLLANQAQTFRNTLKRCCYILVNNWEIARNYDAIRALVQLFSDPILAKSSVLPIIRRLRNWLKDFVTSPDFQELTLFAARYPDRTTTHWTDRYVPYLLVPQYVNLNNPFEQRQAARALYKKMKAQFKFDLAMYTAHASNTSEVVSKNPTRLGDEAVQLIKRIVLTRRFVDYPHLAHVFLEQTQYLSYREFKCSLIDYLIFSIDKGEMATTLRSYLADQLNSLYQEHDDDLIDKSLRLRTANRLIDYLTIEKQQQPSTLFTLFLAHNAALTLVVILLKLVLSSQYSRTHLEVRIAELIKYYEIYAESECQWIIRFLEILNIAMTIYTENVEYSLVNMTRACSASPSVALAEARLADYRIFSQLRSGKSAS